MTQTAITPTKIEKTAGEISDLMRRIKRKLLEFEIMMNLIEIKQGKFEIFDNINKLFKALK